MRLNGLVRRDLRRHPGLAGWIISWILDRAASPDRGGISRARDKACPDLITVCVCCKPRNASNCEARKKRARSATGTLAGGEFPSRETELEIAQRGITECESFAGDGGGRGEGGGVDAFM